MEQKLASLLRVLSAAETQIDLARAPLTKSYKDAFKLIDTFGRNILSSFEISQFLEKQKVKLEQDEVRMIVQYYDISRKGKLDPEAFQKAVTPRNKQSADSVKPSSAKELEGDLVEFFNKELDLIRKTHTLRVQLIQAAQAAKADLFKTIDKSGKKQLTAEDIDGFLQKQGVRLSTSELKAILQRADRNKNGVITSEEFESFVVPDVTAKKVLAKQPDPSPKNASYNSNPFKAMPNTVSDTPLTVSQVVDKYTQPYNQPYNQPKYNDYKSPTAANANYRTGTPSLQSTQGSYPNYSSNYQKSPPALSNTSYTPYVPGMYSNPTSPSATFQSNYGSNPNPIDHRPDYRPATSTYSSNPRHDPNQDLRLSQYPLSYSTNIPNANGTDDSVYRAKRPMNKSISMASFRNPTDRYDASPTRHNYHSRPKDMWAPNSAYHSPTRHYDGYDSPYRGPREPRGYGYDDHRGDFRDYRSHSPSYESRYGAPGRDDYYRSPYPGRYGREVDNYGSAGRPYERPYERRDGYGPYNSADHLRFTSDMLNRGNMGQSGYGGYKGYSGEGVRNWGAPAVELYGPQAMRVSRGGVGLYDMDQLRSKYNNLARSGMY